MVTPRSRILAENEVKPKSSELWAGSDSESHGKGQPWALHRVESSSMCFLPFFLLKPALWFLLALFWLCFGLSGFPELTIMPSLLKWLLSITQWKTWYYKPAYINGLLPSLRAFINYVQKYSKVVANSLDWFWLHKRQVISNYEN